SRSWPFPANISPDSVPPTSSSKGQGWLPSWTQHTPLLLTMAPGPGMRPITAEKIKAGTGHPVPSLRPLLWTWEPAWVEHLAPLTTGGAVDRDPEQADPRPDHQGPEAQQESESKSKQEAAPGRGESPSSADSAEEESPQPARQTKDCLQGERRATAVFSYSLRAFGITCLGFEGNKREKEKRGTTALHSAKIPRSQKDGPLLWQQQILALDAPQPGGGSERLDGEGEQKGQAQAEASSSKEESDEETPERGDVRATRRGLQGTVLAGAPQNLGHLIQPPSNTAESRIFYFNQSLCLYR
ncbi:hypothetical protein E2I00_013099, partial [Balaenoptera physalus]